MKTSELIRLLNELDPNGNNDVVIDNIDILNIELKDSYWDGCKQILIRDPNNTKCYNIIGAEFRSDGTKLNIRTLSIKDALLNNPNLPVKVVDTFIKKTMQETIDKWRKETIDNINRYRYSK